MKLKFTYKNYDKILKKLKEKRKSYCFQNI